MYPIEVEGVLETHPDVVEAVVVGLVDPTLGEVPAAAVRVRDGADGHRGAAPGLDRPAGGPLQGAAELVFTEDLPRTGTNKVQKRGSPSCSAVSPPAADLRRRRSSRPRRNGGAAGAHSEPVAAAVHGAGGRRQRPLVDQCQASEGRFLNP